MPKTYIAHNKLRDYDAFCNPFSASFTLYHLFSPFPSLIHPFSPSCYQVATFLVCLIIDSMSNLAGPVTLESLVNTLAYIHHYTIPYLRSRGSSSQHLQRLSTWIGLPQPQLKTIRQHKLLMAHIALLQAADLLAHSKNYWFCVPDLEQWLELTSDSQYQHLLDAVDKCAWQTVLESENWGDRFDAAYANFIHQTLAKQKSLNFSCTTPVFLRGEESDKEWRLSMPASLRPKMQFHLLQLGEWQPDQPLRINPVTIAAAAKRGYGWQYIQHLIEDVTQSRLSSTQEATLLRWVRAAEHYHIQDVTLLSTAHPEQLGEIMAYQRLGRHVKTQLSPRHAIVSSQLQKPLRNWLFSKNKFLDSTTSKKSKPTQSHIPLGWLGLSVLIELKKLLPLPILIPGDVMEETESLLSTKERYAYQLMVDDIMRAIKEAIKGEDAFFPAAHKVSTERIEQISKAIEHETTLMIAYQAIGDCNASCRTIQPLRLEQRGALYYLHAYCYRAEMNLTFRLDRMQEVKG